jgi:hypothetical protein
MAMSKLGYIHRNLSSETIILVPGNDGSTGVLIDLEYVKEFPADEARNKDCRTVRSVSLSLCNLTHTHEM